MNKQIYNLLLADDDDDDCIFFREALDELSLSVMLTTVHDGVELMNYLATAANNLPDILFLDLNMPRKNGYECLTEIKGIESLKQLPVIIFSTSLDTKNVDLLYDLGATYYIRKPGDFLKLKKVISDALAKASENNFGQPARVQFILQS